MHLHQQTNTLSLSSTNLMNVVTINELCPTIPKLTLLSVYNTPAKFDALPHLQSWLNNISTQNTPTFIMIDSNLHHRLWNPPQYSHTHPESGSTGRPTTIDLTWTNHTAQQLNPTSSIRLNNHSSDHQPINTRSSPPDQTPKHLSITLGKLKHKDFTTLLRESLKADIPTPLDTNAAAVDQSATTLSEAIRTAYESQGKWVKANLTMVELQNIEPFGKGAKQGKTSNAQDRLTRVKTLILPPPRNLQNKGMGVENLSLAKIPGRQRSGTCLPSVQIHQGADHNTPLIPTSADLSDIPTTPLPEIPLQFPPITKHKIHKAICKLPNKKAAGPDNIPNKLLKIAENTINPYLLAIFNACLKIHHFPHQWKEAITTIIRKSSKDDYTDPNAYRPIALLNTLGKLFEKIFNDRLVYWAKQSNALHQGHVGGRPGRCINDAFTMLSTWIHHKWREKKVVVGLFLYVKSAYPTGSPLSVKLYLLYNSNLLLPGHTSLDNNTISIAYIDNVTHLIAGESLSTGLKLLAEVHQHSQHWRLKHGAIFNSRKMNVMVFTKKKIDQSLVQLDNQKLTFENKIKWLGIALTPGEHLKQVKRSFNTTFTQLTRIARPTFGLNQKESRQLISAVLLTQILHGSIMWFTEKNNKSINRLLTTWHHKATRLCTGMMRQTPIAFLKHYGNVPNLTTQHQKLTHNYIHQKLTGPKEDPATEMILRELPLDPKPHPSPLSQILGKEDLLKCHQTKCETILTLPNPPWARPIGPIKNILLTKEQAKSRRNYKEAL
ncbi:hypothetical protein O181_042031 [Austropuccinia psidii MF-1]|uniref:Reverse transcriptase domain-containing protein n=1 Tax=Austropuccinia psidii MF-1 TaxID=1389203 RepID=A0A9Q3HER8_9BASI|nr:hypothetical protein [Austropuccinia psidii MF-1]